MRTRLAVIVFFCFFLSLHLSAQKFTGTIRGLVTDTSGAVVAGADPVESRRIHHRQRLEHHGVDQREDGGGCADAKSKREHRRQSKYRR